MKIVYSLLVLCMFSFSVANAQNNQSSFSFKKGEVLDILLLTTTPNSGDLFERYRTTAFPVAVEYGYEFQPTFGIAKLIMGNHVPDGLVFGKWESKEKREGFLANISKRVPDFHAQRRALFEYFVIAYFEMPSDVQFSINKDKYNVTTAFWDKDSGTSASFFNEWKDAVVKSGGKIIIELRDSFSPIGYYYNPDIIIIAEWESESAFKAFSQAHPLTSYEPLKNVHQFAIN